MECNYVSPGRKRKERFERIWNRGQFYFGPFTQGKKEYSWTRCACKTCGWKSVAKEDNVWQEKRRQRTGRLWRPFHFLLFNHAKKLFNEISTFARSLIFLLFFSMVKTVVTIGSSDQSTRSCLTRREKVNASVVLYWGIKFVIKRLRVIWIISRKNFNWFENVATSSSIL